MLSLEVADEVYARLRDLFEYQPELFTITADGLTLSANAIDEHILRFNTDDAIPGSTACHAALRDRYLLRATQRFWVLLPDAFGVDEERFAFSAGSSDNYQYA